MEWCRCPHCGHKLFLYDADDTKARINIKCSSCKNITTVVLFNCNQENKED